MNVTAMLVWYDEPPALLRTAIDGAAVIADRIVVADGAYWLVPDKKARSPRRQKEAIVEQASWHGLELDFLKPQIYPGQVAKRDAVLQRAIQGSDWVMVVDADWEIHGDREAIRSELEQMHANGYEQVAVNFVTPDDASRSWDEKAANEWHRRVAGLSEQLTFIYRTQPEMHYGKNHWSLYAVKPDGNKLGLFGAAGTWRHDKPKTGYLHAEHVFIHRCLFREPKQILRNRDYIAKRDFEVQRTGVET